MKLPFYWIDAFAGRPFAGNPAGVVILSEWPADHVMQAVAFEHGLAETAFLVRTGEARYQLRWFTPAVEVDLCGHATLGSGHVVFHELGAKGDVVTFDTRSGELTVARRPDRKLELDFPATPPAPVDDPAPGQAIAASLGVTGAAWIGRSRFDWFVVLETAAQVQALQPDLARVAALGLRGMIATAPGIDCDFVSRFFAPQSGVPEDPVTGSAHCALTPYWAERFGRERLHARQLSRRGGELWCELAAGGRVRIAGETRLYLRGTIEL